MAIENFKPEVLENALIEAYREVSIVDQITMKPSKVEGKLARFNVLAAGQIKDYEGTVEPTSKNSPFSGAAVISILLIC